jgi:hypothetical protein
MNLFRWPPRIAQYPSLGEIPPSQWEKESQYLGGLWTLEELVEQTSR